MHVHSKSWIIALDHYFYAIEGDEILGDPFQNIPSLITQTGSYCFPPRMTGRQRRPSVGWISCSEGQTAQGPWGGLDSVAVGGLTGFRPPSTRYQRLASKGDITVPKSQPPEGIGGGTYRPPCPPPQGHPEPEPGLATV